MRKLLLRAATCLNILCFIGNGLPAAEDRSLEATADTAEHSSPIPILQWESDFAPDQPSRLIIEFPPSEENDLGEYSLTVQTNATQHRIRRKLTLTPSSSTILNIALPPVVHDAVALGEQKTASVITGPADRMRKFTVHSTRFFSFVHIPQPIVIDGQLNDWPGLRQIVQQPFIGFGAATWHGPADAWFRFDVCIQDGLFYFALQVFDEDVTGDETLAPWEQDGFELRIDPRPQPRPHGERVEREQGIHLFAATPKINHNEAIVWQAHSLPEGTEIATSRNHLGWCAELRVPLASLGSDRNPQDPLTALRINVTVNDHDPSKGETPGQGRQLWWRPDWRQPHHAQGGIFLIPLPPAG